MTDFNLRKTSNRYFLFHKDYLEIDRKDVRKIAEEFGKTFGLSYEKMKVKKGGVSYQTDDSDYYGNTTLTDYVPTWIILRWAELYHTITRYPLPHEELLASNQETINGYQRQNPK